MFKRILKTLTALIAGHGIQTLTQLLVPPAFIAGYGVSGYGHWLVLSAAVGYLGTLDFGLQTYVLNELTALYHRNELEQFHKVQSVGLRLTLLLLAIGLLLASSVFLLPLQSVLKLAGQSSEIVWSVFFLALQLLASIPLGQIIGIYRTCGQAHRGAMWNNFHRLLLLVMTILLASLRVSFWAIALGQLLTVLTTLAAVLLCLRLFNPTVCPQLDYWDKTLAAQILKASAFFALFILNQFLIFQAPMLLLNRALGPSVVVVFSICRTLFSFVRQGNSLLQAAIAPEVTRLNGIGDREKLVRVYLLSESVILSAALIVNVGLLVLSPTILWVWLKRPELFDLELFLLMMLISILMSVKEYKLYFQYATNQHKKTGLVTFTSYLVLICLSYPVIQWAAVNGFLICWVAVEALQIVFLHFYNLELLKAPAQISIQPAVRLSGVLLAVIALLMMGRGFLQSQQFLRHIIVAFSAMLSLLLLSFHLFGLKQLLQESRLQLIRFRFG